MKPKTNVAFQVILNGPKNVTAVVAVSSALSMGGAANPNAVPAAGERREQVSGGAIGVDGSGDLDPGPVVDIVLPAGTATAMWNYNAIWRAPADKATVDWLRDAGLYRSQGGPTASFTSRHRHHLEIQASSEGEAILGIKKVLAEAGVSTPDLEIIHTDHEQSMRMVRAIQDLENNR